MSLSRRAVLAGAVGGGAFSIVHSHRAKAAEFTFRFGHDQPTMAPLHMRATQAGAMIANESAGRLVVQVYPNNQLGTDTQMLGQVRSGALDLMTVGDNILGQIVPAASLAAMPFIFNGPEDKWAAMDGPFGRYIHAQTEKLRVKVFDKDWDGVGFRHVETSTRPVHSAADMKGLKLRVPEAPIDVSLFRSLGASPTPLDNSEIYTALQTHLVDGVELGLDTMEYLKLNEVTKYISLTAHQVTIFSMIASEISFLRLPKDLQDILIRNLNKFAELQRADCNNLEADLKTKLQSQGQTIITPDRESFRAVVRQAGLYAQWRDTYGAEPFSLLEKTVGKLT